jgi:Tat protein translocase TatC
VIDEEEIEQKKKGRDPGSDEAGIMSLGDHLDELRKRIIYSLLGFVLFFIVALFFQDELLEVIARPHFKAHDFLAGEIRNKLAIDPTEIAWRMRLSAVNITLDNQTGFPTIIREIADRGNSSDLTPEEAERLGIALQYVEYVKTSAPPRQLTVLKYQESFLVYMKTCALFALLIGIPWTLFQFWKFISVGLYMHERKIIYIAAPLSLGLFIVGILFGYFLLIKHGLRFLITYGNPELIRAAMTLGFYFNLFFLLTMVVGLVFQLPLIMLALAKIGIVSHRTLSKHRRVAILTAVIVGAFLTPPDPVTQIMLATPIVFLYEFGLILVRISCGKGDEEESESRTAEATA